MFKPSKCSILLSLIVCFSFIIRILLIFWGSFPPSSDLGLHNSVVYSITQSGNTDFLWNYYNMGEGVSLTFPGYHIFVSYIIILTGLPEYLVHSLVAAFFSSFIILVAFLITRKISNTSAALIVAFLAAFSRFDFEMLMWGGYPNVVTLMLIPLAFYLFMQRQKMSLPNFLIITSLVSSAIFLTHSLSMAIFVVTIFITFVIITIVPKTFSLRRIHSSVWILPLFFGVLIIFPFVINAIPTLLTANSSVITGDLLNLRLATLSTQTVNWDFVYPILFYFLFIFLFSKKQNGKFFTIPAFLLVLWILIPTLGSQSHLFGFYTDYNRFRYFVYLPIIIVYGIFFDCTSGFFAKLINNRISKAEKFSNLNGKTKTFLLWLRPILTRKTIYAFFILILLLYSLSSVSMFLTPSKGIEMQEYYQIVNEPLYDAIQWIKTNTSPDSIIASDAKYGWWLAGFTQRQILSGSEPQYLILSREFEPAEKVLNLLDANYILDNGIIQIREDGAYIGRHNPIFLAKLADSYFPHGFFHLNNDEIVIRYRISDQVCLANLSELSINDMSIVKNSDSATISITQEHQFFNYTQKITLCQGVRFANISIAVSTSLSNVCLDWASFNLHTIYADHINGEKTYALYDSYNDVLAQLIFVEKQPEITKQTEENPSSLRLDYNLAGVSDVEIELFVGTSEVSHIYDDEARQSNYVKDFINANLDSYLDKVSELPLNVFDYKEFLTQWNISYVAVRDDAAIKRFENDSTFSLVFANAEVKIFKVNIFV